MSVNFKKTTLCTISLLTINSSCKQRTFNTNNIRASENSDSNFEDIKTIKRPIRLYSWDLNTPPAKTTALEYFNTLEFLAQTETAPNSNPPPLLKIAEDDYSAMGAGGYFAFSPTESAQFGYSRDMKMEGVLRSFVMPLGARYILVAHESFLARARKLFPNSGCKALAFEAKISNLPAFEKPESIVGLKGIQGIFRSCPELKLNLLTDSNGKIVDFVVFPEVNTYNYDDQGTYKDRMPTTRVDRLFPTQAKPRWALLTHLTTENKENIKKSIKIWSQSNTLKIGDETNTESYNKRLLHCAVEVGSKTKRLSRTLAWANGRNYSPESIAQFLGYDVSFSKDITKSLDKFSSQENFKKLDQFIFSIYNSDTEMEKKIRNTVPRCPSLYSLLHGPDAASKTFANNLVKQYLPPTNINLKRTQESICPGAPRTLALGVLDMSRELPIIGQGPIEWAKPDGNICLELYKDYLTRVAPTQQAKYLECSKTAMELTPFIPPNSLCTPEAKKEIMSESFLSLENADTDLGQSEKGDDLEFLIK